MPTAIVQGVEWTVSDEVYNWSTRHAAIEIGPGSIWEWHPVIGAELKSFRYVCEQLQPETFIDIGAHAGIFSSVYCSLVQLHNCHSIEPIQLHMERLHETKKLNSWNLTTHSIALNDYEGEIYYHNTHMAMFTSDKNYVVEDKYVNGNIENKKLNKTTVTTLDNFVKYNQLTPQLIKLDVEGYEIPILRQATDTLKNNIVNLFVETHRDECKVLGWDVREICRYLSPDQYSFYTNDFSEQIADLESYLIEHDSNMRFIAIHKYHEV